MKTLNGVKTNLDVIAACDEVLRLYKAGDNTPSYQGVNFDGAALMGHCQQNVRELVEAVAYGRERAWGEASCCATATHQRLRNNGWASVSLGNAQPGDLVYMSSPGGRCSKGCGQRPGHVGILHHKSGTTWHLWQNTSYDGLGLCLIPLRTEQITRIVGIYRLFPLAQAQAAAGGKRRVNWHGTYLEDEDVMFLAGAHFVSARAAAEAEGSVVKVDRETGKVFVGPAQWWE